MVLFVASEDTGLRTSEKRVVIYSLLKITVVVNTQEVRLS